MFGGTWWFIEGAPGERFCWAKDPTFECPHAYFERKRPAEDAPAVRTPTLVQLRVVEAVAGALGVTNEDAMLVLERAHSGGRSGRRRVAGKLTDRCAGCGAKMRRRGFRAWRDELVDPEDVTEGQRMSAAIGTAMGGDGKVWRTVESHYHETKREAEAWARAGVRESKAAVAAEGS